MRNLLTKVIPSQPNSTINPIALTKTKITPSGLNDPATTSSVRARARRLSISSITAAPIIAFAASDCNWFISRRTFAVMAILVAVRAVPTKNATCVSKPKSTAAAYPPIQGTMTPSIAIILYCTLKISRILNSNPITNRRIIAPR